jgi:23S rRNA A1618 N6-methylase RlmF
VLSQVTLRISPDKRINVDIDPLSFQYARQNVGNNNLQQRIEVVQVHPGDALFLRLMTLDDHSRYLYFLYFLLSHLIRIPFSLRFDFTMCNPPFYSSIEDITRSAESKEFAPHAVR